MNWLIKAGVQKIISHLPQAHKINFLMQRYITVGRHLPNDYFIPRLQCVQTHLNYYAKHSVSQIAIGEVQMLEIGTGWHPIVPLGLYLSGANCITTIDIRELYNHTTLGQTIEKLVQLNQKNELKTHLPSLIEERFEKLVLLAKDLKTMAPKVFLKKFGIIGITGDARQALFNLDEFDLVLSDNVLQDIQVDILTQIIQNTKIYAKNNALFSHYMDCIDQFCLFDNNITPYNYLKYTEKKWKSLNNALQTQNRMRIDFYRNLFANNAFQIVEEKLTPGNIETLKKIKIDKEFAHIPADQLATTRIHIVALNQK